MTSGIVGELPRGADRINESKARVSSVAQDGHVHSQDAVKYRPEIDGLRAIAVMSVVLFHAGFSVIGGGFVGVDVFFVISGYLITGILYREASAGHFSIVRFYERRIRRLFPALYAMLATVTAVALLVLLPDELTDLAKQIVATSTFISNFYFNATSGYFDAEASTKPLLHTWSLAVEEQFYLFFPFFIWGVVKWARRYTMELLILAALISLALSIALLPSHPTATFYLLPTRAWELLIGGIAALAPRVRPAAAPYMSWAGLALIAYPALTYTETMPFPGLSALPPCLGTALILHSPGVSVARLLSAMPMRWIGKTSYSLYLWHWPVIVFLAMMVGEPLSKVHGLVAVAASIALGFLSWKWIEQPLRTTARTSAVWFTGAGCIAGALVIGCALIVTKGLPGRFGTQANHFYQQSAAEQAELEHSYKCAESLLFKERNIGPCNIGASHGDVRIFVVGDSQAMAMKPALNAALAQTGVRGRLISVPGCPPLLGLDRVNADRPCAAMHRKVAEVVAKARPEAVILIGSYRLVLDQHDTAYQGRSSNGPNGRLANASGALADTVAYYRQAGARVGFVVPAPGAKMAVGRSLARGSWAPLEYSTQEARATFAGIKAAARHARVDEVLDLGDVLCEDRCSVLTTSGEALYMDKNHPNAAANAIFAPHFAAMAANLLMR